MQKTTQGRIHAHLQRAAELLSFGTNAGDKLKLQTVDQRNKPMTLWIQIHKDAVSRERQKQMRSTRLYEPDENFMMSSIHEEDNYFETDFIVLAYEGPDIENYATQDISMRGRRARLRQGHDKTQPFEHYSLTWSNTRGVSYDDVQLLYRPFIEVPYTPPPQDGAKMYKYDNSGRGGYDRDDKSGHGGYDRVGSKRKR